MLPGKNRKQKADELKAKNYEEEESSDAQRDVA